MAELPSPRPAGGDPALEVACQEFVELVTEYLEGSLAEDVERAVAAHLELCEACAVYLEQMRRTSAALRATDTPALPEAARLRLLEVFRTLHARDGDGGH
ncbi:anti-sigma factor family protein [Geodermatophilus sp. SYSU D00700]